MKSEERAKSIVLGALLIGYGAWKMHWGTLSYLNYQEQPVFPAGVIAIGLFVCALALLPPTRWIYPLITTKRRKAKEHPKTVL